MSAVLPRPTSGGLLTLEEAAEYLAVSTRTVKRLIVGRQLRAVRPTGTGRRRPVRIRRDDLEQHIQRNTDRRTRPDA